MNFSIHFRTMRHLTKALLPVLAVTPLLSPVAVHAQTCPFDTGGSDAVNDGVVLTRYALGITGAPLTASTRYASLDPLQVKANIECVGCALDINGDSQVDTVDTTIIARHLAGFQGASLMAGLALGAGTRNTTASVVSFLANGCAVGGAINAFVHGGNTFALGAGVASVLGNNDTRPLTVQVPQSTIKLLVDPANGDDGLRISYAVDGTIAISPNTINGSRVNIVAAGVIGATIAGGGVGGSIPSGNQVNVNNGAVGGGRGNRANSPNAVVAGGVGNTAGSSSAQTAPTVGGGNGNTASGDGSTVPGGITNIAAGDSSFAAGRQAQANHNGAFVWGDSTEATVASTGVNQFVIRAGGGIRLPGAGLNQPGNSAKQSGTNMFTHQVPVAGQGQTCLNGTAFTAIDHPLTNNNPAAILVVTPSGGDFASTGQLAYRFPVAVYYESRPPESGAICPQGRWVIYNAQYDTVHAPMESHHKFNVFVINP